jgi:hypothetical protein
MPDTKTRSDAQVRQETRRLLAAVMARTEEAREAARKTHDLVQRSRHLLRELRVPQSMAEVFLPEQGSRPLRDSSGSL